MKTSPMRYSLSFLAVTVLVVACGGGDEPVDGAVKFAGQMRAAGATVPLAAGAATTVTADMTLDWAEYKFSDLFPKSAAIKFPSVEYEGVVYNARAYVGAWGIRYLGITPDGRIFGLGDFTGNALQQFNDIPTWAPQVLGDQCNVYPGSCGNPPVGPLNECVDPVAATLPTGFRSRLVYDYSGELTGEQTVETVIDGPSTFEGQSAIKITSTTSGTNSFEGSPLPVTTTKVESFEQIGANGVTKTLGALVEVATGAISMGPVQIPGSSTLSKIVYTPPRDNLEFRIALGQSATFTSNSVLTTLASVPPLPGGLPPPQGVSTSETYTFEAKESVTVLAGTYEACRYRIDGENASTYVTTWYILGKGVPAKIVSTVSGVASDTQQLKPGSTYNGAPL